MAALGSTSLSSSESTSRQQCLDMLDDFISTCQNDITNMLDTLGWTPEHFMQPKSVCTCPHDSNHRMTPASLEQHKHVCGLVSQGCTREEAEKIQEDTSFVYQNSSCVYTVKLDKETLNSVLWNHHVQNHSVFHGYSTMPLTPEQEAQMLTREDRLGMSEYIVRKAKEANRLKELGRDGLLVSENLADLIKKDSEDRKLDPVEEMAALRDYRRRRQTYRAKNVHITKKPHTAIMREVITNQMEMYAKSLADNEAMCHERVKEEKKEEEEYEEGEYRQSDENNRQYRKKSRYKEEGEREDKRDRQWEGNRRESPGKYMDSERERDSSLRRNRREERSRSHDSKRDRDDSKRDRERSRHKRKDRHRTRSRSKSSERSKKSKHKSKKHKKHKHRHHSSDREDGSSANHLDRNYQSPTRTSGNVDDASVERPLSQTVSEKQNTE